MAITLSKIIKIKKNCSKEEQEKIQKAYNFAKKAHHGQILEKDKSTDYFLHQSYVAFLLAKWGQDTDLICAGLLHDVIEDCEVSLDTIWRLFSKRTTLYVDGMSWIRIWNNKTQKYEGDWPNYFARFCRYAKDDSSFIIIKAADEWSKQKPPKDPAHLINNSGPRAKIFWIPFFREVGLMKVSDLIERRTSVFIKKKYKSQLYKYLSKKDLAKIKNKLTKIRGIGELRT